jgi:hypothetical protein
LGVSKHTTIAAICLWLLVSVLMAKYMEALVDAGKEFDLEVNKEN